MTLSSPYRRRVRIVQSSAADGLPAPGPWHDDCCMDVHEVGMSVIRSNRTKPTGPKAAPEWTRSWSPPSCRSGRKTPSSAAVLLLALLFWWFAPIGKPDGCGRAAHPLGVAKARSTTPAPVGRVEPSSTVYLDAVEGAGREGAGRGRYVVQQGQLLAVFPFRLALNLLARQSDVSREVNRCAARSSPSPRPASATSARHRRAACRDKARPV